MFKIFYSSLIVAFLSLAFPAPFVAMREAAGLDKEGMILKILLFWFVGVFVIVFIWGLFHADI